MPKMHPGRTTHRHSGELVVFLIGMRFNRPWRIRTWLPAFLAMPKMLAELSRDPHSGLLGYQLTFGAGGPMVVQYWDSHNKLYAYASASEATHRPAWTAFNQRARKVPGAVGIWHETYLVDRAETLYASMPPTGLALATTSVPVERRSDRAAQRLAAGEAVRADRAA